MRNINEPKVDKVSSRQKADLVIPKVGDQTIRRIADVGGGRYIQKRMPGDDESRRSVYFGNDACIRVGGQRLLSIANPQGASRLDIRDRSAQVLQ